MKTLLLQAIAKGVKIHRHKTVIDDSLLNKYLINVTDENIDLNNDTYWDYLNTTPSLSKQQPTYSVMFNDTKFTNLNQNELISCLKKIVKD